MQPHPKFGKCPETIEELEQWLERDARICTGGARCQSEFYLEVVSAITGSDAWERYKEEVNAKYATRKTTT